MSDTQDEIVVQDETTEVAPVIDTENIQLLAEKAAQEVAASEAKVELAQTTLAQETELARQHLGDAAQLASERHGEVLALHNQLLDHKVQAEAEAARRREYLKEMNAAVALQLAEVAEAKRLENERLMQQHEAYLKQLAIDTKLTKCGVFDANDTLLRICEVPEHMVSIQANAELGETVRRGAFVFVTEEPVKNYTAQRLELYPPHAELADAMYHFTASGDDTALKNWTAKCKDVKELVPKELVVIPEPAVRKKNYTQLE